MSAKFFLYAGNGKYFEVFFTLNLNGIVVNGWPVSSAAVRLVATHAKKQDSKKRRKPKTVMTFAGEGHRHDTLLLNYICYNA